MPIDVYRCAHCGREVLVRSPEPLTAAEIDRRIEEETRPNATGPRGSQPLGTRLRDDIWQAVSERRIPIPRYELPEQCPACGRQATLIEARTLG